MADNNNLELISFFYENKTPNSIFNENDFITFKFDSTEQSTAFQEKLIARKIKSELFDGQKTVKINLNPTIKFFGTKQKFLNSFKIDEDYANKDIVINDFENSFLFYNNIKRETYVGGKESNQTKLIEYSLDYLRFKNVICTTKEDTVLENLKGLAEYNNKQKKELIFISPSRGKFVLSYNDNIYNDDNIKFTVNKTDILKEKLKDSRYNDFFINAFIDSSKEIPLTNRLSFIYNNLETIFEEADRNFEIFKRNFSFDEVKNKLRQETKDYYKELREILGKVYSQVLGLPIALSTSLIVSYKVENPVQNWKLLILILIAYNVFAVFFNIILFSNYLEIKDILKIVKEEISKIESELQLSKDKYFIQHKKIIFNKIDINRIIIMGMIILMNILSILLNYYILFQVSFHCSYSIIYALVSSLICFIIWTKMKYIS